MKLLTGVPASDTPVPSTFSRRQSARKPLPSAVLHWSVSAIQVYYPAIVKAPHKVMINRAPVLTLWAAVVAEQLGYEHETALTLGKCVAGLNAQSKGRMLGIFGPPKGPERGFPPKKVGLGEDFWIEICSRGVPVKNTADGIRAVVKDEPIDPDKVSKYLDGKFGDALPQVTTAMQELAGSFGRQELSDVSYSLYERFRPKIPPGQRGWGARGELDLGLIRSLAEKR